MFAPNAIEVVVVVGWVVGVVAAVGAAPLLAGVAQRVGLVVAAIALPVLGSALAIAVALVMVVRGSRRPAQG